MSEPMSRCVGCGAPILWIEVLSTTGVKTKVPVDMKPPVYAQNERGVWERLPHGASGVTHFATCPKANNFSKGSSAASYSAAPPSSDGHGEMTEAQATEFCLALDSVKDELELSDFEGSFLASIVERAAKYNVVRFSEKQLSVVRRLRSKYRDQVNDSAPPLTAEEEVGQTRQSTLEAPRRAGVKIGGAKKPVTDEDKIPF